MQDICIAPVSISNNELLQRVIIELRKILQVEIQLIDLNLDLNKAYSSERRQYYSTQLIAEAVTHTTHLDSKIVILVEFDLFIPVFTYVFGEAQLNGKHSIVSLCRLHEEFYTGRTDHELLFERTIKEILHELGHNFGLLHCSSWDCVMHASAEIEEVDIKGRVYCKACSRTLQNIFNFRVN